ncbi:MAG TPA: hypothetical protein VN256_05175 [Pyrinomonadaceae bacterium]|nr:hypothetical protein [Pyrinomonadaceae bacterium]
MEKRKLAEVEEYIFDLFRSQRNNRLLARTIFESTGEYANADLVRAFEDLEKKWRLLVRYTDEGNDWIQLTPEGAEHAGITGGEEIGPPNIHPRPPKSSTQ